jgi:hypothetical protein
MFNLGALSKSTNLGAAVRCQVTLSDHISAAYGIEALFVLLSAVLSIIDRTKFKWIGMDMPEKHPFLAGVVLILRGV